MKYLIRQILIVYVLLVLPVNWSPSQFLHAADQRTWQSRAPMPTARTGVTSVVLNDKIYVMGGLAADGSVLNTVEIYDPATNTWQQAPNLRTARYNSAAVIFEGQIYLMGGRDNTGNATKKVEVFNPGENDWNSFDNLNDEREGLAAVVLDGEIYVMGGSNGNGNILDSVEYLDVAAEKWEYDPDWRLDVPRALFAAVSIDDLGYVIGGFSSFGPMGLVQQYDQDDGTEDLEPLYPGKGGLGAATLDETIYAIGGRLSTNQVVNTVNQFLPDENRWLEAPGLTDARERFAVVSYDDKIFVFGGNNTSGAVLNSVEVFATSIVPLPEDDILVTAEDAEMSINVLVNDIDPAGGQLTISSFSQPANGSVRQLDIATFSYAPNKDFFGADEFSYTALNETGGTAQARVIITVGAVNDPPVFATEPVTGTALNTAYTYTILGADVDGDQLTFSGVEVPDWLSLMSAQQNQAVLSGTPGDDEVGEHAIRIQLTDGEEVVEQAFTLTVVEGVPGVVELLAPSNGAVDTATDVTVMWQVPGASSFDLEVALDSTFSNIVREEIGLLTTTFDLSSLDANTQYFWRVRGANEAGSTIWSAPYRFTTARDTGSEEEGPASIFVLHPNYPNPFRSSTNIAFELTTDVPMPVELAVYDVRGRQVAVLETGLFGPGQHSVVWNGRDTAGQPVASGTYILKLQQDMKQITRLVMLLR